MKKLQIFPALFFGDVLHLADVIKKLEPHCAGFHLDIIDFHFAPMLTAGPHFVNAVRLATDKPLWVDLQVDHPDFYLDKLALHENDIVTVHYESNYPNTIFKMMRNKGWVVSLAISPKTPVEAVEPLIDEVDHIVLMSTNPGLVGQAFLQESITKIKHLSQLRKKTGIQFEIAMDGGLNEETLPVVLEHGLNYASIGAAIFNHHDPVEALKELGRL